VDQTIQGVDQTIYPDIAKILAEKGIQQNGNFLDLIDLSEGEGESFGEFCRRETAHFDPPLRSLPDYLASRDASGRPRYWPLWEKYQAANPNWRSHPQRSMGRRHPTRPDVRVRMFASEGSQRKFL
jgi:hypothetical protein